MLLPVAPPYREPASRPPEPPPSEAAPATPDAEPERDDASTMWVSDADARVRDDRERRARLAMAMVAGVLIVATTVLFAVIGR